MALPEQQLQKHLSVCAKGLREFNSFIQSKPTQIRSQRNKTIHDYFHNEILPMIDSTEPKYYIAIARHLSKIYRNKKIDVDDEIEHIREFIKAGFKEEEETETENDQSEIDETDGDDEKSPPPPVPPTKRPKAKPKAVNFDETTQVEQAEEPESKKKIKKTALKQIKEMTKTIQPEPQKEAVVGVLVQAIEEYIKNHPEEMQE